MRTIGPVDVSIYDQYVVNIGIDSRRRTVLVMHLPNLLGIASKPHNIVPKLRHIRRSRESRARESTQRVQRRDVVKRLQDLECKVHSKDSENMPQRKNRAIRQRQNSLRGHIAGNFNHAHSTMNLHMRHTIHLGLFLRTNALGAHGASGEGVLADPLRALDRLTRTAAAGGGAGPRVVRVIPNILIR
jgi:hypothetical protein